MGFIRTILIGIDAVIYTILEQIFLLILNLANFDLFTGDVLKEFSTKIYLILGLVMVFKLMLSFIQILIDPDKINDKETGVVNILKRVVICMILIVLVPSIFSFAKRVQNLVIPIIPKVVLGVKIDVDDSQISYDETITDPIAKLENEQRNVLIRSGKLMAYYSFLPFFYYNSGCDGIGKSPSGERILLGTLFGTTPADKSMNVKISSVLDAVPHVNDKTGCSATSDGYDYNYRYLISTLVGAYLVYVLVTVALKIAIRAIKFGICELIAPIPIASYIDPKSSKKAFDNWVSTSVKVYLDLFVRLIVVYFIVYIFKILFDGQKFIETLGKYGPFQGLLVALFIIIGLLYFAREMPKFVSDMLGVSDGFSDIGDMFKGQGFRAIANAAGTVAGTARAGVSAVTNSFKNSKVMDPNRSALSRGLLGGFSALNALRHGVAASGYTLYRGASSLKNNTDSKGIRDGFENSYHSGNTIINRQFSKLDTKRQARQKNREQNAKIRASRANIRNLRSDEEFDRRQLELDNAETNARNELSYARNRLATAQNDLNDANNRLTVAQNELATANGDVTQAQTDLSNAQNALNSENTNFTRRHDSLTQRRDVLSNYASLLTRREKLAEEANTWRQVMNDADNPADRAIAQKRLTDIISNMSDVNNQIDKLKSDNATGGFTWHNDSTAANRSVQVMDTSIQNEENRHNMELSNLQRNVDNAQSILDASQARVTSLNTTITDTQTEITEHENLVHQREEEVRSAQTAVTNAHRDAVNLDVTIQQEIQAERQQITDARRDKIHLTRDRISEGAHDFIGQPAAHGQDYLDLSSQLKQTRADVLISEAFGKVAKNISDVNAHLHSDGLPPGSFRFSDKSGQEVVERYEDMVNARAAFATGRTEPYTIHLSDGSTRNIYRAQFDEYMDSAEKAAGAAYVTAACTPGSGISNEAIVQAQQQELQTIGAMNIPAKLKSQYLKEIREDFGRYLLRANDRAAELKTYGQGLKNHEQLLARQQNGGN